MIYRGLVCVGNFEKNIPQQIQASSTLDTSKLSYVMIINWIRPCVDWTGLEPSIDPTQPYRSCDPTGGTILQAVEAVDRPIPIFLRTKHGRI